MSELKTLKVGKIQEFKLEDDPILETDFTVKVSELFTTITIGKRSFYFNANDGSFDGTGTDL